MKIEEEYKKRIQALEIENMELTEKFYDLQRMYTNCYRENKRLFLEIQELKIELSNERQLQQWDDKIIEKMF